MELYRLFVGMFPSRIKPLAKSIVPAQLRRWLRGGPTNLKRRPAIGKVRFGQLRRVKPIAEAFGFGWGKTIARFYIESFLTEYAADVRGHVMEIAEDTYTHRYGGERVVQSDILHVKPNNPKATIIADLSNADHIPSESFHCIILTQTLQYIYNVRTAIQTLHRILKPGGVLLATFPGISQIARFDMEQWGEHWHFTTLSAYRLFTEVFPHSCVKVKAYGNVLTAIAYLHGILAKELRREELDYHDPDYELLITVRAVREHNSTVQETFEKDTLETKRDSR
jgi:SAM-dependent methyltransferase